MQILPSFAGAMALVRFGPYAFVFRNYGEGLSCLSIAAPRGVVCDLSQQPPPFINGGLMRVRFKTDPAGLGGQ
jgi:hypothetical protein